MREKILPLPLEFFRDTVKDTPVFRWRTGDNVEKITCRRYILSAATILSALFFAMLIAFAGSVFAEAPYQTITDGGKLAGTIQASDEFQTTILLDGGGEITLDTPLIKKRSIPSPDEILWRKTAPLTADTLAEHERLADWCRRQGLAAEAKLHFERILELDPENEAAHKALDHVKLDGVWMTPLERKEQLGYQNYGGRSVTAQEAELFRQKADFKKEAQVWKKRIKSIESLLRDGDPAGLEQLRAVTNPAALEAITDRLRRENDPQIRILYVQAMGKIASPAAMGDLASVAMVDDDYEVRLTALERIAAGNEATPSAIRHFRRSLFHSDNTVVNRAASALGYLNATEAIGDLINTLVTRHQRTVVENADKPVASFQSDGNFSFNPGGAQVRQVTDTVENADVLAALVQLVGSQYGETVDFGFDILAWKDWLMQRQEIDRFNTRRSE